MGPTWRRAYLEQLTRGELSFLTPLPGARRMCEEKPRIILQEASPPIRNWGFDDRRRSGGLSIRFGAGLGNGTSGAAMGAVSLNFVCEKTVGKKWPARAATLDSLVGV